MRLLVRARFLIFTLLAIVLGGLFAYLKQNPPLLFLGSRSEAACQGDISKFKFKIHPQFYLNKNFLPSDALSESDIKAYIEKQMRYVYLTMPGFDKKQTPRFSVIPFGGLKISNIDQKHVTYPLALKVSWQNVNPLFLELLQKRDDIDSLYMKKALAAGSTSTTDQALLVSYEAEAEVLLCENETRRFADEVILPVDPFLAFWFVPEDKRIQKLNQFTKETEAINPCANEEFQYDYDPYYYWHYFALDENSCKDRLLPRTVQSFKLENKTALSTQTRQAFDLKFLDQVRERTLKMTTIFTLIDDDTLYPKKPFEKELFGKVDAIIANPDFNAAKAAIAQLEDYDIAMHSGLIFAWSLRQLSDNFKITKLTEKEQLVIWQLQGELKQSHQKYEVNVTIGSAMETATDYDTFYASLNHGLAKSDIVYFGGHSGVGKNLSENRIQEQVKNLYSNLPSAEIPDHQLLVLMTCYSLHYFPPNGFPMPNKAFQRDILQTASVPSGYDARLLLGIIEQADSYLAKGTQLPFEKWPSTYGRDVFLVHQRTQKN